MVNSQLGLFGDRENWVNSGYGADDILALYGSRDGVVSKARRMIVAYRGGS
jgi:hypothetical protein